MKVILTRDILKLGHKGEIKEVSEGYANNFLIKLGYAKLATPKMQEQVAQETQASALKQAKELNNLEQLKADLEKRTFSLAVKVGDKGQVFGGVHEKEIAGAINSKLKTQVEKSQINVHPGIKALGEHEITLKLGHGITAKTKLNITAL